MDLAGSAGPGPADEVDVSIDIKLSQAAIETNTRSAWQRYEAEKATIKARLERGEISADEYDRLIKQVVDRLEI